MNTVLELLDTKDIFYCISGFVLLMAVSLPFLKARRLFSSPMMLIVFGALLSFTPLTLPLSDFRSNEFQSKIMEHFTEFVVIISLAGVGLSIDRRMGVRNWSHTWLLLFIVMPLTILVTVLLGYTFLAIPMASAILLGAVLAPTDPVLARSVQVEGPNQGEENDVNVSLTSEAGLNDGLAFPFIYLALTMLAVAQGTEDFIPALTHWFFYDLIYRVGMGTLVGLLCGYAISWLYFKIEDKIEHEDFDAGVILLGSVFLTYGLAEAVEGYGFLAVFVGAITGRMFMRKAGNDSLAALPHRFSDQIEKICISFLLVWLGFRFFTGALEEFTWQEGFVALAFIFLVRPIISYLSLIFSKGSKLDRFAISFLGIRGIGSLYYLAYAQNSGDFEGLDSVWRVTFLVIVISIFLHGVTARKLMLKISGQKDEKALSA